MKPLVQLRQEYVKVEAVYLKLKEQLENLRKRVASGKTKFGIREDEVEEVTQPKLSGAQVLSQRASRKADDQEKLAAEKRKRLEGSSGLLPLKQLLSKLNHESAPKAK